MTKLLRKRGWIPFLVILCSCADNDVNLTCPDPLGADSHTIEIKKISCFQAEFDGCFEFRVQNDSLYIQSVYVSYPDPDPSEAPLIYDAGKVNCLSELAKRPLEGWTYRVWATKNHGYVFRMKDGSLGRMFIDSWESQSGVTKVNYTRQYPY